MGHGTTLLNTYEFVIKCVGLMTSGIWWLDEILHLHSHKHLSCWSSGSCGLDYSHFKKHAGFAKVTWTFKILLAKCADICKQVLLPMIAIAYCEATTSRRAVPRTWCCHQCHNALVSVETLHLWWNNHSPTTMFHRHPDVHLPTLRGMRQPFPPSRVACIQHACPRANEGLSVLAQIHSPPSLKNI